MSYIKYYPLTESDCYKANQPIVPTHICIHSTGASNPFLHRYIAPDDGKLGKNQYNNHWNQPGSSKCCHAFCGMLDDETIAFYQTLPFDINGWHCGGNGNNYCIGIEICEGYKNDKDYFYDMIAYLCNAVAEICISFNISPDNITSHRELASKGEASNHGDPDSYFIQYGYSLNDLKNTVKTIMEVNNMFKVTIGEFKSQAEAESIANLLKSATVTEDKENTTVTNPDTSFKVGDKVKVKDGCGTFTNGASMQGWVLSATLYVRAIEQNGNVCLVSTEPTKEVYTGRVYTKNLTKV